MFEQNEIEEKAERRKERSEKGGQNVLTFSTFFLERVLTYDDPSDSSLLSIKTPIGFWCMRGLNPKSLI